MTSLNLAAGKYLVTADATISNINVSGPEEMVYCQLTPGGYSSRVSVGTPQSSRVTIEQPVLLNAPTTVGLACKDIGGTTLSANDFTLNALQVASIN